MNREHARPQRTRPRDLIVATGVLTCTVASGAAVAALSPGADSTLAATALADTGLVASPSPTTDPTPATTDPTDPTVAPTPTPEPAPALASAKADGSYNFAPLLSDLDSWIVGADLALCHFKVPPPTTRSTGASRACRPLWTRSTPRTSSAPAGRTSWS